MDDSDSDGGFAIGGAATLRSRTPRAKAAAKRKLERSLARDQFRILSMVSTNCSLACNIDFAGLWRQ